MTKLLKLMKLRMLVTRESAQSFLTGLTPTGKLKHRRNRTSQTPITRLNFTTRRTLTDQRPCLKRPSSLTSINQVSNKNRAAEPLFVGGSALALGYAAFRFLKFCGSKVMDSKLRKVYYSPQGYWKGLTAIKKLAEAAKVSKDTAKQWLIKQVLWQIYLPFATVHFPAKI